MKKSTKLLPVLLFCLFLFSKATAQQADHCSTPEMNQKLFDADPQLYAATMEQWAKQEALDKEAYANGYKDNGRAAGTVYTFPVVFHIIHQNGPENVSDAQILDGLKILNEDFRKLNSDFSSTVASFQPIAADCEIEFCLAKKDPNGQPTSGIDRIVSSTTNNAGDNARLNPWNTNNYLNIWIVASVGTSGSSGYTYYPTNTVGSTKDGVMLKNTFLGSIGTSQVRFKHDITHEVGHYFDLRHVFEGGSTTTCGDDGVTDTPKSKMHDGTCPTADKSCVTNEVQNMNNYMDYSFCYTMFTAGQKTRMRNSLINFASRKNQWTSSNLITTGCNISTGLDNEPSSVINFSVFPNPAEENTIIKFDLQEKQKTGLKIIDITGREVAAIFEGELNSGQHQYPMVNNSSLSPGIYFATLTVGDQHFTKKLIIK